MKTLLLLAMTLIISKTDLTITSPAFQNNGTIPAKYTCSGSSINP